MAAVDSQKKFIYSNCVTLFTFFLPFSLIREGLDGANFCRSCVCAFSLDALHDDFQCRFWSLLEKNTTVQ